MDVPKWKRFEELVGRIQSELAPDSRVTVDDRIIGKRTGAERQIDVSVRRMVGQFELLIVIDCKDYAKPIDVKDVEEFMGLAQDVGAHKAAMVSAKGFSATAKKRAEDAGIELYRVLDSGDHPWRVDVSIPAVCEFTGIKVFGVKFAGTGRFALRTDIDWREIEVFDLDEKPMGKIKELLHQRWNDRALPEDAGWH